MRVDALILSLGSRDMILESPHIVGLRILSLNEGRRKGRNVIFPQERSSMR
jgi:hypothetical protein